MKRTALFNAILLTAALAAWAIDGREIIRNVREREAGSSSHALVQMDLIDKSGGVNSRTVEMVGRKDSAGNDRMVIIFHKPATVANTRFLTLEHKGRDSDRWIYMPALKRVRRIAASEGGESFMGSDFSYDDISQDRDVDKDEHRLLREETFQGQACYVVESTARDAASSQYSRRVSWVSREMWLPLKIELYDKSAALLKTAVMEKVEKIQNIWTPMRTVMNNIQTQHATLLVMQKFVYNENLPEGLFTTKFIETGKP
jgi:outer membrane lipoprotein-sorting protein